jgi:hypothetical protein
MFWGSKAPTRYPYYTINRSYIFVDEWKEHAFSKGCYPIRTEQTVLLEKLPSGESPYVPPPPKLTREQKKAQKIADQKAKEEAEFQKWRDRQQLKAKAQQVADSIPSPIGEDLERELPPFDLRDLPKAMKGVGFTRVSQLLEKWFLGPAYRIPPVKADRDRDFLQGVIRIEDEIVTLDWARKFGKVNKRIQQMLSEGMLENTSADIDGGLIYRGVYHENAKNNARKAIEARVQKDWDEDRISHFSFNTKTDLLNFPKFHDQWQFQLMRISAWDTIEGVYPTITDLTLCMGNHNLYAAIGIVEIVGDRYYEYNNSTSEKRRCFEPVATLTHVYLYLSDDFEVNPKDGEKRSQYLGHWNLNGFVISELSFISDYRRDIAILEEPFNKHPILSKGTTFPIYTGPDNKAQADLLSNLQCFI